MCAEGARRTARDRGLQCALAGSWSRPASIPLLVAALVLLSAAALPAQPPDEEPPRLPETVVVGDPYAGQGTVVTPTRSETDTSRVGSSLTVITREQIDRSRFATVGDVLRGTPGLDVVQQGAPGGLTSVFLRGANSQHTKVLLDGIPINDPSNASRSFDFSTLSVDQIERIEILRGPQSSVWGSDALGGVINIVTARGSGPATVRASAQGGSFGTHREAVGVSGGKPLYHYALGGSYLHTDGFSSAARRLGNTERDGFQLGTLGGRTGIQLTADLELEYIFRWQDARAEIDDSPFATGQPPTDDPLRLNLTEAFYQRVQTRWSTLGGIVEHVAGFNLADYDREDTDDILQGTFQGQARRFDYLANVLLLPDNVLTAGVDYLHEEASSVTAFSIVPQRQQNNSGVYLQDQIGLGDRWFTTVGVRWDEHSAAGEARTYRAASIYHIYETGTSVRGSIGTGFRAPALAENLFPFGNPNLRPERVKGWDYGIDQWVLRDRLRVGATYYRLDFTDLILFDFATFTLENVGRARTSGVEIYGSWDITPLTTLAATYTVTDSLDFDTGQPLLRRPRDKASVSLGRRLLYDRAYVGAQMLIVGKRLDARDGSVVLDDYIVVNLAGHYDVTRSIRLFWRIDNLFDAQYEEATGFESADLSGYGGVFVTW